METEQGKTAFAETAEPEKRLIKSDFLLFVAVFILVTVLILIGNRIHAALGVPFLYVQAVLLLLFLLLTAVLYRTRLVSYRYTLTGRMFSVERIVGNRKRREQSIHLRDIVRICPYGELRSGLSGKTYGYYHGAKEKTTAVLFKNGEKTDALLLSMTEEMGKALIAQWKKNGR